MVHDVPSVRVVGYTHPRLKKLIGQIHKRFPRYSEGRLVGMACEAFELGYVALLDGQPVEGRQPGRVVRTGSDNTGA